MDAPGSYEKIACVALLCTCIRCAFSSTRVETLEFSTLVIVVQVCCHRPSSTGRFDVIDISNCFLVLLLMPLRRAKYGGCIGPGAERYHEQGLLLLGNLLQGDYEAHHKEKRGLGLKLLR